MNFPTITITQFAFLLFLQQTNLSYCASIVVSQSVIACDLKCISAVVTVVGAVLTTTFITLGCIGYFCKKRALENAIQARSNNQGRIARIRIVANRNTPNPATNTVSTVVTNPVVALPINQPAINSDNVTNNPDTRPPPIPGYTYNIPNNDVVSTVSYPPTQTDLK